MVWIIVAFVIILFAVYCNQQEQSDLPPDEKLLLNVPSDEVTVHCTKQGLLQLIRPEQENDILFCHGNCDIATSGQSCQVGCRSGLLQTGFDTMVCQSNGLWSWNAAWPFSCSNHRVTCDPIYPTNFVGIANVENNVCIGATPGDTCSIYCHVGTFAPQGIVQATCQSNGKWSHELVCQRQACSNIDCTM